MPRDVSLLAVVVSVVLRLSRERPLSALLVLVLAGAIAVIGGHEGPHRSAALEASSPAVADPIGVAAGRPDPAVADPPRNNAEPAATPWPKAIRGGTTGSLADRPNPSRSATSAASRPIRTPHPSELPALLRGDPGCGRVALIFNVGVGYEPRLEILEDLKADDVPATVFPMGWWATAHPAALKRIAQAGFPIGSHGDQPVALTERGETEVLKDIRDAEVAIERATGVAPAPYFTPYAAASDERVRALIAQAGYLPVGWEVPADDWDFGVTPDAVFDHVVPNVTDGAIVEFHLDAPASAESTAVALPWIVERLRAKGYRFVTVPELTQPCA